MYDSFNASDDLFITTTVHCAGDITDLFDAFDGFSDSAYHAYIGFVEEGEYMEEAGGDGEDDGEGESENEGEEEGPSLAEEIANIVAADHNNVESDCGSDGSNDSCSDAGDSADAPMGCDSTSFGYSTMYAQLYTDECVYEGNICAVVTIVTCTV